MRVLAATLSVVFAASCTASDSTAIQNSSGDDDQGGDDQGGDDQGGGGEPCATSDAPIVFAAMLDGQAATDLYVLNGHATPIRLTTTPGAELFPAWSPDRKSIAFVRDSQLFVLDVVTRSERLVAERVNRTRSQSGAAWSPDGARLVYPFPREPFVVGEGDDMVDESYATTLHFVNADGTNDVAFVEPPEGGAPPGLGTLGDPAWSSSNELAFFAADDCPDCAGGSRWAVSNADGSDYREVVPGDLAIVPLYPTHNLDWSPDAASWVFTARNFQTSSERPGIIATSPAERVLETRQLTTEGAWYPRYAPDASAIAFLRADGIYVMNANGTAQHRILRATGVRGLDW